MTEHQKQQLTPDTLECRVTEIIEMGRLDDEQAHIDEDDLHRELIREFCPKWVVDEVERLGAADFARWCA